MTKTLYIMFIIMKITAFLFVKKRQELNKIELKLIKLEPRTLNSISDQINPKSFFL